MRYFEEIIKDQNDLLKRAAAAIDTLGEEKRRLEQRDVLRMDPVLLEIIVLLRQQPEALKWLLHLLKSKSNKRAA